MFDEYTYLGECGGGGWQTVRLVIKADEKRRAFTISYDLIVMRFHYFYFSAII